MKKLLIFIFSFIFILPFNVLALAAEEEPTVKTKNGYYNIESPDYETNIALLVNADTDTVIYSKNADKITAPASLTKIVTALVVLSKTQDLQKEILCTKKAVDSILGTGSSMIGLKADEKTTLEMLLYCLFLPSANDAAAVLADHFGNGDEKKFVAEMNEYVKALGCKNTHFSNPHGLDDESIPGFGSDTQSRTTASDMYLISKEALKSDIIKKISSKYGKTMPATNKYKERYLYNTNQLLNSYSFYFYDQAIGLKTGTTEKAGACLVSSATKDGYTYIAIAMQGNLDYAAYGQRCNTSYLMCRYMLKWAFENIKMRLLADSTYNVGEVGVKFGRGNDYVGLVPEKDVSAIVHRDITIDDMTVKFEKDFPKQVKAPVKQGEVIGKASVYYKDVKISDVNVVARETVKKNHIWAMFSWLEKLVTSKVFIIIVVVAVAGFVVYMLGSKNSRRRRKRRKQRVEVVKDYSKLAK